MEEHVECKLFPNEDRMEVWKGGKSIGFVQNDILTLDIPEDGSKVTLSFMQMDIIKDSWNQLFSMKWKEPKSSGCPECGCKDGHYRFCQQA